MTPVRRCHFVVIRDNRGCEGLADNPSDLRIWLVEAKGLEPSNLLTTRPGRIVEFDEVAESAQVNRVVRSAPVESGEASQGLSREVAVTTR
jgi:hypothetical protein